MDRPKTDVTSAPYVTAHPTTESAAASSDAPALAELLTHEDVDRARDRWEVARARLERPWSEEIPRCAVAMAFDRAWSAGFSRRE